MYSIEVPNLSLEQIYSSGQCFRWIRVAEDKFIIPHVHGATLVQQNKEHIAIKCDDERFYEYWFNYFDIATDYAELNSKFRSIDDYIKTCAVRAKGMRILRQDTFEMIITFMLATATSITRVEHMVANICKRCGEQMVMRYDGVGVKYAMFPTPQQILDNRTELRYCKLGYREERIIEVCDDIVNGWLDLDFLKTLDYYMAKKYLMEVNGIGPKVADCICLYALHHMDAFPVDTHMEQILEREYGCDCETFTQWYLEGNVQNIGLLQQYMFYNEINPPEELCV